MKHLTEEQLSALLDDALPAGLRAAAEAHLAECDACRTRLAEASALDESLGRSLAHDPGEAYFADFAERVGRRIAASAPRQERPRAWGFRRLALAGSTVALLATAGLAWMRFHEDDATRVLRGAAPRPMPFMGARSAPRPGREQPSHAGEERARLAAPPAAATPSPATAETAPPPGSSAATLRAQEVRRLPSGEEAPVPPYPAAGNTDRLNEREGANAAPPPAPATPLATIKRRALGSAKDESFRDSRAVAPAEPVAPSETRAQPTTAEEKVKSSASEQASKGASEQAQKVASEPQRAAPSVPTAAAPRRQPADTTHRKPSSAWGTLKYLFTSPPNPPPGPASGAMGSAAPEPQPASGAPSTGNAPELSRQPALEPRSRRGGRSVVAMLQVSAADTLPGCGSVRDARGQPIAGAQLTAMHDGVRTARTGPDGRFCFDVLRAGDTLTVLHVGFDPLQIVVGPRTLLALQLEPVGTLGPEAGGLLTKGGAPTAQPSAGEREAGSSHFAPAPDVYAGQPEEIRDAVAAAREATGVARRERSAAGFEKAADLWTAVGARLSGAASYDARFQSLAALREALRAEPTADRAARLRQELAAFVAASPRSLPERATAVRWQSELRSTWGRGAAGYR